MQNLNEFLSKSKMRLQTILEDLKWTTSNVIFHNNTCSNKQPGPEENELLFPSSSATQNSVLLNNIKLREILRKTTAQAPQKFSDLQISFNREEKILLYEHVKSRIETKVPGLDENYDLVSLADIVAMKKREKKNRRKHRVSKPTHTEELRSLVDLQMQSLEQCLRTKSNFKPLVEDMTHDNSKSNQQQCQSLQKVEKIYHERSPVSKKSSSLKKSSYDKHQSRRYHCDRYNKSTETIDKQDTKHSSRSRSRERRRTRGNEHQRSRSNDRHHSQSKKRRDYSEEQHSSHDHVLRKDAKSEKYGKSSSLSKHKRSRNRSRSRSHYRSTSSRKRSRSRSKIRSRSHSRGRFKTNKT